MAEVKRYTVQKKTMEAIAEAIRKKTGSETKLTPAQIVSQIGQLSRPAGTLAIGANGTYDVRAYERVNVQAGGSQSVFTWSWNPDTGALTIIDPENPLPEVYEKVCEVWGDHHEYGADGYCACGAYDEDSDTSGHDCERDGHDYMDGYCVYCGAAEPWDCNANGHDFVDGCCIYCGEPDPGGTEEEGGDGE